MDRDQATASDEEAARICALAREGWHMCQIVPAVGRSESCVRKVLKRYGVQHVPSEHFWNMTDLAELERFVADDFFSADRFFSQ